MSVIIPAFNSEATIDTALASVASQTVMPEMVIVQDDGSSDGTVQRARKWQDVLPMRVSTSPSNEGPARARARAIAGTSSSLISLLDSDDFWLPEHLSSLVNLWRRRGGLVTTNAYAWYPGECLTGPIYIVDVPRAERQFRRLLATNYVFVSSLFAADDYHAVGGFREQFVGVEDWDLWIRMSRVGVTISRLPDPTVWYRVRPGSLSRRSQDFTQREISVLTAAFADARSEPERAEARRAIQRRQASVTNMRRGGLIQNRVEGFWEELSAAADGEGAKGIQKVARWLVAYGKASWQTRHMR